MNEDEMGGACSTHEINEKYVQDVSGEYNTKVASGVGINGWLL
jgi:hypothetical protein